MRVYNTRKSLSGFKNVSTKRIRFGNSSIKVSLTDYQKLSKLISDFNTNKNSIISFIEDLVNRDPYNNGHIIFDADISEIKDIKNVIKNVIDSCGNILLSNLQSFNNDYKLYTNDRIKYLSKPENSDELNALILAAQEKYTSSGKNGGEELMNANNEFIVAAKAEYDQAIIDPSKNTDTLLQTYEADVFEVIKKFNNYITDNNITYISKIE